MDKFKLSNGTGKEIKLNGVNYMRPDRRASGNSGLA
jgi:hypothetical protein